jgi:predicted DCC family thiol-disulfide oxidoreductase YuxK
MRIIYFDGICNLCNGFVDYIIQHDLDHKFHFASLQSRSAQKELLPQDLRLDSVVLSENGLIFRKSEAVLKIFGELGLTFKIISIAGKIAPVGFANLIYDIIAKNRYRFFGQRTTCRIPTTDEKLYFLD